MPNTPTNSDKSNEFNRYLNTPMPCLLVKNSAKWLNVKVLSIEKDLKSVPKPHEIKAYLDEHIVGQDDAKRVLNNAFDDLSFDNLIDVKRLLSEEDFNIYMDFSTAFYFSFVCYFGLGFGDFIPCGPNFQFLVFFYYIHLIFLLFYLLQQYFLLKINLKHLFHVPFFHKHLFLEQ